MGLSVGSPAGLREAFREQPNPVSAAFARRISAASVHPALLVSVRNAAEARLALDGGCEVLDVKEPGRGSLGMADAEEIVGILAVRDELAPTIPVSIALGEAIDWGEANALAAATSNRLIVDRSNRVQFLKLGTAGLGTSGDWRPRFRQACRRWESQTISRPACLVPQWVAVAYADWKPADAPPPDAIISGAADCGCSGLLIDTFTKTSGGLFYWFDVDELRTLAIATRQRGMWFALAGGLALDDLSRLRSIAPDVVGIRTAACRDRQRNGEIDPAAVRAFRGGMKPDCQTGFLSGQRGSGLQD